MSDLATQRQNTDSGLANNAMQAMSNAVPGGNQQSPNIDMASVLAKIQALEREKNELSSALQANNNRLAKFQEGKKAEMEAVMNSTISKWLEGLDTKDVAAKDQLKNGLQSLIDEGNESGVWNVIACASSNWAANVNSIENLTNEVNSYKEKEKELHGGMFADESNRISDSGYKRKASGMDEDSAPKDIWGEFESLMMNSGGNRGDVYTGSSGKVNVNSVV